MNYFLILIVGSADDDGAYRLRRIAGVLCFDLIDQPIALLNAIIGGDEGTIVESRTRAQEK